jgi:ribosomal subunit interface protein
MVQKFEIRGVHMTVDESLQKYVTKKIGGLDKYLSRHDKPSAHIEVHLKESKSQNKNHCTCKVIVRLPHDTINIEESTLNMYAAVDIVETKLKQQLRKHRDMHGNGKLRRRLVGKFRRTGITLENIA